jgi:hypothetical protein
MMKDLRISISLHHSIKEMLDFYLIISFDDKPSKHILYDMK